MTKVMSNDQSDDVVFDEYTDDDIEYNPVDEVPLDDEQIFDCELCEFKTKYPNK